MAHIFLAGATGVVGKPLLALLLADGHAVTGTTRSPDKAAALAAAGATPAIVDAFDRQGLIRAVAEARAEVVIHQLTDLPPGLDPTRMAEAALRNARIRELGTANLLAAALAAGARRFIAQSIAFNYAPDAPKPWTEETPLDVNRPGGPSPGLLGQLSLERQVLEAPLTGIVLRYGRFYAPGTGVDAPPAEGPVHVMDAAEAARLAVTRGGRGIYNVVEEDGTVSSRKAMTELGWRPGNLAIRL